jgi:citrate lyase subunit beta/citryl-CoA lyase
VQWSRKVIEAFALKEHKGKGVITVEGRMVERLHLVMAERVVAIWKAIAS